MIDSPKRVITVDDDGNLRRTVKRLLQREGYFVDEAADADEGWKKIRLGAYDLVLLDVMMPGMLPSEIISATKDRRRLDPDFKETKIIILTAVSASKEEKRRTCDGETVVGYIEKPFDNKRLVEGVRAAIGPP